MIEYNLPASPEEAFKELSVESCENGRHEYVDRVSYDFVLTVSKNLREALGSIKNLADRLFVTAHVQDGGIIIKKDVRVLGVLVYCLLHCLVGQAFLDQNGSEVLVVSDYL